MGKADCTLSQEELKNILEYNPDSGLWLWNTKPKSIAGGKCPQGYWRIKILKKSYKAHRLAWLYVHGEFPKEMIDHVDGDRLNNKLANLRLADNAGNQQNRVKPSSINKAGFLGVNFNAAVGKYASRVQIGGKRIHIGYFDTPEEASSAYNAKKTELTQFFNPERI